MDLYPALSQASSYVVLRVPNVTILEVISIQFFPTM